MCRNLESQIPIIEHKTDRMKKILRNVLLASGARITSDDILNRNLIKRWQHIQNKIVMYEFPPAFDAIKRFADECEKIYIKLSPEIGIQYDWGVLNKINVVKVQTYSNTLDYQKLLQFFCDNFRCMVKASIVCKPNANEIDRQGLLLYNLLDRVSTRLKNSEEFDRNDSAIHLDNSMSDNESSVDLQYMMALLTTTPIISNAKVSVTPPQRISLVNEFQLIPNLEHQKYPI